MYCKAGAVDAALAFVYHLFSEGEIDFYRRLASDYVLKRYSTINHTCSNILS
jgi:hypothetical protein